MTPYTLVSIGVAGIQDYIFRSNRLRENIGASYLVMAATEIWPPECIRKMKNVESKMNVESNLTKTNTLDDGKRIEGNAVEVEFLYMGGGNCVMLFRSAQHAQDFTWELSSHALTHAPGLTLDIHHADFDWDAFPNGLAEAVAKSLDDLKAERSRQPRVMPLAGLGVTVMCGSTALPAVGVFNEIPDPTSRYPMSAEVQAKIERRDDANDNLRDLIYKGDYEFPLDFEDISVGEYGMMAVIHADGDGMGKRIAAIKATAGSNRDYITRMRALSSNLKGAGRQALQDTINHTVSWLEQNADRLERGEIDATRQMIHWKPSDPLPIRPLVFGGDDLTMVCDGRLGLAMTLMYLERFEALTNEKKLEGGAVTSSAGVALVKPHYPFARAYNLAEELAASAKTYKREAAIAGGCLDWHFTTGGLYDSIDGIRQREYCVPAGNLTARPIAASGAGDRAWPTIAAQVDDFQDAVWASNKRNAFRMALRGGKEAVASFYNTFDRTVKPLKLEGYQDGWKDKQDEQDKEDKQATYYDALELADFYVSLELKPTPEAAS